MGAAPLIVPGIRAPSEGTDSDAGGCSVRSISDLDIWRAAYLLIGRHGAEAELEAAKRADLMLDRGDFEGQTVWRRIRRAIVEVQSPPTGPAH
jgi:hypothetical protein